MIVADTNVISELLKPDPNQRVLAWLRTRASELFTTSVTQAEILYGLALLPLGRRRATIAAAMTGIFEQDFSGRVLAFDSAAAHHYGRIAAHRRQLGRPMSVPDAQIAAIALARGAEIATRDAGGFADCGVKLANPWA